MKLKPSEELRIKLIYLLIATMVVFLLSVFISTYYLLNGNIPRATVTFILGLSLLAYQLKEAYIDLKRIRLMEEIEEEAKNLNKSTCGPEKESTEPAKKEIPNTCQTCKRCEERPIWPGYEPYCSASCKKYAEQKVRWANNCSILAAGIIIGFAIVLARILLLP